MGAVGSGLAETVHSLDISPSLHNELEQLAVKQQKMLEQQAFEAHFAQVADAPHLQRKTQLVQVDAEAAKRFESISQAEVPRLVSAIEENCFRSLFAALYLPNAHSGRPTERSYPCQAQKDACLQCFGNTQCC